MVGAVYDPSLTHITLAYFAYEAETFGIVISASQGLEATIEIVKRFKKAYDRNQEQAGFLDRYRLELLAIKEQVGKIEKDKALATSAVLTTVFRLKEPVERLAKWLTKVDRRGQKSGFLNQLVNGNTERKKLEEILGDMARIKPDLSQAITVAVNERTKRIEKGVVENGVGIQEIKGMLVDSPINPSGQQSVPKPQQVRRRRKYLCFDWECYKSLTEMSRQPKYRVQGQWPLIKRKRRRQI
jgi:hypothetical protein